MKNLFLWYPKCSTCQNAKKWLERNEIKFQERHIVEEPPSKEELEKWIKQSGLEIKKFFNTSGLKYKELNLKEKLPNMSDTQKIELLSTNGMLIKRPLFINDKVVLVGFKEKQWEENIRIGDKTPIFPNGDFGTDPNLPQPIIKGKGER